MAGNLLTVTSELGTLGLPGNVLTALANVSLRNDGAYSAPQYQQPSSPPSGWDAVGAWIWNSVSGIASAVAHMVSVVWNGVIAAAAYLGEAVVALSNELGLTKLASQFVHALKTLASAMEWALEQLVNYIVTLVKEALAAIVDPIISLAQNYYSNLNSSLASGNAVQFANALDGPFFLLVLGLATAVEVALTLLTPIDLGPSFLVGLLIGLLIQIALKAAATSGVVNALSGVTNFGGQIVRDFQGWVNTTSASADVKLPTRYNQIASMFSGLAGLTTSPFVIGLLAKELGFAGGGGAADPLGPILVFALAVVTIGTHIVFAIDHVPIYLLIPSSILGVLSTIMSVRLLAKQTGGLWRLMAAVDAGVSAIASGVSVYEVLSER